MCRVVGESLVAMPGYTTSDEAQSKLGFVPLRINGTTLFWIVLYTDIITINVLPHIYTLLKNIEVQVPRLYCKAL